MPSAGSLFDEFFLLPMFFVMAVEFTRERDTEEAVLGRKSATREKPIAEVTHPGAPGRKMGSRVLDYPYRSCIVARGTSTTGQPQQDPAVRVLQAPVGTRLPVG